MRRIHQWAGLFLIGLTAAGPTSAPARVPDRFTEPAYSGYFADPFAWRAANGMYYAVGTGGPESRGQPRSNRELPIIRSQDLQHWESLGLALNPPAGERREMFWAPETAVGGDGRTYLYYSVGGRHHGFRIRAAVGDKPDGPYTDVGSPLTDPAVTNGFAIDPHVFRDDDGQRYLFYATDFYDSDPAATPPVYRGTALAMRHLRSMTELDGPQVTLGRAHWPWQRFEKQRRMGGVVGDWYTMEGPTVVKRAGRYYCFYSGGNYQNDTYGLDYLWAGDVHGPWHGAAGDDRGPQVMRTVPGRVTGPGHNSIVTTPDGRDLILYHAWDGSGYHTRQLWIDPLQWTPAGPRVARFAGRIAEAARRP